MSSFLRQIEVAGEQIDLGSDFHSPIVGINPSQSGKGLASAIGREQRSKILCMLGDPFESEVRDGVPPPDTAAHLNVLLHQLGAMYHQVLYVPGNHCLRRRNETSDPWRDIDPPKNVLMPRGVEPVGAVVGKARIVLANLFYDGRFIEGHQLSDETALRELYASTADGSWLLRGQDALSIFRRMTASAASFIQPDVDLFATHPPPHPSSATWFDDGHGNHEAPEGFQGTIASDPELVSSMARHWGIKTKAARKRLNNRTALLGSNVFRSDLGAKPKEGLVVAYGHHHQQDDRVVSLEDATQVRFVSHQKVAWRARNRGE